MDVIGTKKVSKVPAHVKVSYFARISLNLITPKMLRNICPKLKPRLFHMKRILFIYILITIVVCITTILTVVTRVDIPPENYCRANNLPQRSNVYFVKTHKTGSSTVQNILMRFGASRDLDFALPKSGNHLIKHYGIRGMKGKEYKNEPSDLIPPGYRQNKGYNISCFHDVFNETRAAEMVPANDTVYITILRDPVEAFESLYSFMKFDEKYNLSIEQFANTDMKLIPDNFFLQRADNYMGVNQMLYDLGMDEFSLEDEKAVEKYIEFLERRFDLVMLQEYFDESMILLRDLMCWNTHDIVYLKQNARDDRYKPRNISNAAAARIRALNSGDQILYEHFKDVFEWTVSLYGRSRMDREVQLFRQHLSNIQDVCVEETIPPNSSYVLSQQFKPWSNMVSGFRLRPEVAGNATCVHLATSELPFLDLLRKSQRARAFQTNGTSHGTFVADKYRFSKMSPGIRTNS